MESLMQSCLEPTDQAQDSGARWSIRYQHGGAATQVFSCTPHETLLSAALRAGIGMPYECSSGGCGSCKIALLDGEVLDLHPAAPGINPRDKARGKRLACQTVPRSDCSIGFKEDSACVARVRPQAIRTRFVGARALTHDLTEYQFQGGAPADFLPGQYALLTLPGVAGSRSYSMSNLANPEGIWEFQIKRVPNGSATAYLFDRMLPDTEIGLDGPYGNGYLRDDVARDVVCIAGGSGLAPMVSVVRGALRSAALRRANVQLFYGAREPHDMLDASSLPDLFAPTARFSVTQVMSLGQSDAAQAWQGERGLVHECAGRRLQGRLSECEFYLAGPPPMVDAVRRMLVLEQHVPVERIHYDRFF
jgi:toluene monooxygenase electron transfer component